MDKQEKSEIKMYQDLIDEKIKDIMVAICEIRENEKEISRIINNNKDEF